MTASARPEIAVIGVGSTGSMALWALARRGARVVGYDRWAPGHDHGAAGGESRIFRTAYKEGPAYVPLLSRSLELWRELERESGANLLTLCGGLTIGPPDHPDVAGVVSCASAHGLELEEMDPSLSRLRYPQHPLEDGEVALLDPTAGVLRPERAVQAAASAAVARGAELRCYEPVTALEREGDRVRVDSTGGSQRFDAVVWAAGPWSAPRPTDLLGLPDGLHLRQITTAWMPARDPALFEPAHFPVVIRRGTHAFSAFPTLDHSTVKLSMHDAEWPTGGSVDDLPRRGPEDLLQRIRRTAPVALPGLSPDPVRVGTYADLFTPDHHGLLGPSTADPRVVLLTGFSGHGFKMSPATGEAAASLVLGHASPTDVEHLDPRRLVTQRVGATA